MDKWFAGIAKSSHSETASKVIDAVRMLLPPAPGTKEEFQYKVGFLWGVFESALNFVDLISMVADILSFALEISKTEDVWSLIKEAAHELIGSILPAQFSKVPFDRGKFAARLLFNLVMLIIQVIDVVHGVKRVLGTVPNLVKRLAKKASQTRNTAIVALEMQKRMKAKRITTEDIINAVKRDVKEKPRPKSHFIKIFENELFAEQFKLSTDTTISKFFRQVEKMADTAIKESQLDPNSKHHLGPKNKNKIMAQYGFTNGTRGGARVVASCEATAAAIYYQLKKLGIENVKVIQMQIEISQSPPLFSSTRVNDGTTAWDHHQYVVVRDQYIEYVLDKQTGYKPERKSLWEKQFRYKGRSLRNTVSLDATDQVKRLLEIYLNER